MGKNPKQQVPTCFFCGGKPLTKEHLLPDWIYKAVGPTPGATNRMLANVVGPDGSKTTQESFSQQPFLNQKAKVVCGRCNSQWMSLLEKHLRGYIYNLSIEEDVILDAWTARKFVRWAIKTAMIRGVWENRWRGLQLDEDAVPYPNSSREEIRNGIDLPEDWSVMVGISENAFLASTHFSQGVQFEDGSTNRMLLCTFRIFHLMVIVTYSSDSYFNNTIRQMFDEQLDLQRIWPMADVPIFPGKYRIADGNVALYQEAFRGFFESNPKYILDENLNRVNEPD